jgi:hypothetical protein
LRHIVRVWDVPHEVTVYQKSKSVWIAVGYYRDERIQVQGSSERSALKYWHDAARYKGG